MSRFDPVNARLVEATPTSLLLTWDAPEAGNGETTYTVSFLPGGGTVGVSSGTSFSVGGLRPGTRYEFEIGARTGGYVGTARVDGHTE